jgi:hypothetical protein
MEEDFPPSTGNDHHRLSFWRLAVSKCRHWLAVFLGPNTRSSAALNLLFSVESASYSVIHPSNSRSLWMSVVSAVYLVLAFYFVCVSNATSDRLNWNSHLTESRRYFNFHDRYMYIVCLFLLAQIWLRNSVQFGFALQFINDTLSRF